MILQKCNTITIIQNINQVDIWTKKHEDVRLSCREWICFQGWAVSSCLVNWTCSNCVTLKTPRTESSLNGLNNDDLILLALDYQQNYDIFLDKISKELAELWESYNKLEADLEYTNVVNEAFRNQIITLEYQCWGNAQYFSRETLETSGIPENIDDGELEGRVLTVLSKPDVNIKPANVEACPWLESNNKDKRQSWNFPDERIRMRLVG